MSNNKCRIKAGDTVVVTAGKDKGHIGRVLKVLLADRRVVVEGARRVKRHRKPVGEQPGGIVEKEAPMDISNVALWSVEESRRVKVGYKVLDGVKTRIDRRTGVAIDQ